MNQRSRSGQARYTRSEVMAMRKLLALGVVLVLPVVRVLQQQ
jgi:hypothetical protein